MKEIGIRPRACSADAAAQLVELAEAEAIGAVDNQRVDRRHIDARLHDGGADEHVGLLLPEVLDDLFELALFHLGVRYYDASLWHEERDLLGHLFNVGHPIVNVKDLALAK